VPADAAWFEALQGQSAEQVYRELAGARQCRGRGRLADVHSVPDLGGGAFDTRPLGAEGPQRDSRFAPSLNRATEKIWASRILAAAGQVERWGGQLPGSATRLVEGLRRPELPWRDWLRQFVVSAVGDRRAWLPPSRRHLHRGLYLPSRREETLRIAVAIDTSASTQPLQVAFLSELAGLVDAYGRYEILLIQGDARIQDVATYTQDEPLRPAELELRGFGGTDFRPVFRHLRQHALAPSALVFLTDGHGVAPSHPPDYAVLWALPRTGQRPAPWGRVVRLDEPTEPASRAAAPEHE
jgi:predicted metal-dependent peptidase